jgi:hypothetical protein
MITVLFDYPVFNVISQGGRSHLYGPFFLLIETRRTLEDEPTDDGVNAIGWIQPFGDLT